MQTEAVFDNIADRIHEEISKAKKSIFIAVAWFTNKSLFDQLVLLSKKGCSVSLIISNDKINQDSYIDFNQLNTTVSRVYKIGDGSKELMHNKFCVIDRTTIITGSYNWSYKAESNFENIIITYEDTSLAEQFVKEFNKIREQYYPNDKDINQINLPVDKVIKRLEILRNYIIIEETDDIKREAVNLLQYDFNPDISEIIANIKNQKFASAIKIIELFITKHQQMSIWTDPEIAALRLELKILEHQLNAFDNEKSELEKLLTQFQHRHTIELSEIILEILRLKKIKYIENKSKYEEIEGDEKEYREQMEIDKEKGIIDISKEDKLELRKKFIKATILCHPDKFINESLDVQFQAEEIFKELNDANTKNDIKRVSEILSNLESGILTTIKGDKLTDKVRLKTTINKLRKKITLLESHILEIKQSETYKTIISITDWDEYFTQTKEELQRSLLDLINTNDV